MNTYTKGKEGEDQASVFLENKGFTITGRNYRSRSGEIDIIAEKDSVLVFIEVKKWGSIPVSEAGYSIGREKKRKILRTAENFVYTSKNKYADYDLRFDLVFISSSNGSITHYENVFEGA